MDGETLRLARLVAVVVSAGFAFGGVIGVIYSADAAPRKAVAFALLAALLLLHLRHCVRRTDGRRPRGWQWTLAAQVALTVAGLVWFAATWYGNTGFLCAAMLLLLRRAWLQWGGFGLVLVAQYLSSATVRPTVFETLYVVVGQTAFVGLALYAVVRLADLIVDLRATQAELAEVAVARERLAFAEQLNDRVGGSLREVVSRGQAVLEAEDPERARGELEVGLDTARLALTEVRSVSHTHREGGRTRPPRGAADRAGLPVAADLTRPVVAGLAAMTLLLMIVPRELRLALSAEVPAAHGWLFAAALVALLALYLRACLPGGERGRGWTLAALATLTYAPIAVLGTEFWYVAVYLPGAAALLLRGPARWVAAAAVTVGDVYYHVAVTGQATTVLDMVYGAVYVAERAIIVYAVWRMATLTAELRAARAELARVRVAGERLRFARDLHDLLGYGLSLVVLKAELAFRLLPKDAATARQELSDGLDAARQVIADIGSVASGYSEISLAAEAVSIRLTLAAAGIELGGEVRDVRLPAEVDTSLATVLREGTTNVLRHSRARRCTVDVAAGERSVRLRLWNDGVPPAVPARGPGSGIGNLRHRLAAVGGELRVERGEGTYALVAEVPLEPSLVGGDADRVDAVPGVELHDR